MTTVSSVKDVRNSKISVQVAVISMLLVPVAGVSCLLFPALAEEALPWYLGVPMVVSAIGSIVAVVRERDAGAGRESLGSAIVLCVLGLVIIVHGANSTVFIGIVWGLLGLQKAARTFDGIFSDIRHKRPFAVALAFCVLQFVLSVLLILNPFANIEHHLIVLGIELLFYSSKPDAKVRFDWLSMLGCAFILCIVGTAAVLPTVWNLWGPEREHAASRIESEKVAGIYNALTGDPALKSRVANAHVKVWISHAASDSYALQAGDECALYLSFTAEYDSDEAFAADCQAVVQAADANGLGFTTYYFSSCDDLQEGTRYTLDCNAAFPVGLTAAQLAGRVEKEYYYDGSAFSTEADRDSYIRAQLENEIEQEYEAAHDGESATKEYLDSEVARRLADLNGTATPETAAA